MELRDYLAILRKRWIAVALVTVLGLIFGALASLFITPQYEARARLYVAVVSGGSVGELTQSATFAERQLASYAEIATAPLVLEPVSESVSGAVESSQLSVSAANGTTILDITATDEDNLRVAEIANAVAAQLIQTIEEVTPAASDGQILVNAEMMETAVAPEFPVRPNIPLNLAAGLIVGLTIGISIAVLREVLDTRVRTEHDVEALTDVPIMGIVRYEEKESEDPLYMVHNPASGRAEAMRRLRTNLQFVSLAGARSIVVTSSLPGEGKSTTSVNLAIAMADSGQRVILVDCDLRRPDVANYTGLEGSAGLTTALIGQAELDDVIQPWLDGKLDVLTSGQIPPNPSELLGSVAMTKVIEELGGRYDVVVIDSPPLLPVADSAILTKMASGALVVVGADRIHKGQLSQTLHNLETVDARVLGTVLNKATPIKDGRYSYSYSYSYEPDAQADRLSEARVPSVSNGSARPDKDIEGTLHPGPSPARESSRTVLRGNDLLSDGSTWPGDPVSKSGRR